MALNIRRRNLPTEAATPGEGDMEALADMIGDIIDDGSEVSQFLSILIADLDAKFFFDGHKGFEDIEGVETKVIIQGSIWGQICFIDAQLFVKNELYFARSL
jgi:hypothetical protein